MAKNQDSETADKKAEERANEKTTEAKVVAQKAPWPLITIGIFVSVIVIALIVLAATIVFRDHRMANSQGIMDMDSMSMNDNDFGPHRGSTNRSGSASRGHGSFMTPAANGVITAINGDTITVAGGGRQVTVKKTTSTSIGGSKSAVAVNDTVIVIGTTESDGSVTATRIMIRNNQNFGHPAADDTSVVPGA